ncbi:MAG: class I tRNA ligase family protein, partial [Wenzhouxiangella sp.]
VPFEQVYITGLIRDSHGHKMSKSKGNVLDPIDLIDGIELDRLVEKRTSAMMQPHLAKRIAKATREEFPDGIPAFGADALRLTFTALAGHGRDIKFDLARCAGYRNFLNKLWNAARYTLMNVGDAALPVPAEGELDTLSRWILSRLNRTIAAVDEALADYRFDLATRALYEFVWNEFCDWYLELSKPALQEHAAARDPATARATRHTLARVLETTLRLLHPFVPFISEEIWQRVRIPAGAEADSISQTKWPQPGALDRQAETDAEWLKEVVSAVRSARTELNLAPGKPMPLLIEDGSPADLDRMARFDDLIRSLARLDRIEQADDRLDPATCATALAGELRLLIPLAGLVDVAEELARLNKQLEREEKGLEIVAKKLANERFVANAPAEVVAKERTRRAEHQAAIADLSTRIQRLRQVDGAAAAP